MSILKIVGTGQPRTRGIFTRNLYILGRLLFGVVYHFFEDEAVRAVKVKSARNTEMLCTFLETELQKLRVETQTLWFQ
jgi:hypothetical protein